MCVLTAPLFPSPRLALMLACVLSLGAGAPEAKSRVLDRGLDLQQRLAAQTAIERVLYAHRIWPKENPQSKPPFEEMATAALIERKTRDPLLKSAALKRLWNVEITPEMLQAEMDRMARDTKDPAMLKELFAALGNDPNLIAETLARDGISDRLIRERHARDPALHAAARRRAEAIFAAAKSGSRREEVERNELIWARETILPEKGGPGFENEIAPDGVRRLSSENFAALREEFVIDSTVFNEHDDGFAIRRALWFAEDRMEIETIVVPKLGFDSWWAQTAELTVLPPPSRMNGDYQLPAIVTVSGCDEWTPTSLTNVPSARSGQTAVWTGAEMIIWGGGAFGDITGGRYYPATDSWLATSVGTYVPSYRYSHTAVWTGKEMIVWGGTDGMFLKNTGGRYDPVSNSWMPTSLTNVPGNRARHTAVWTGSEMVIWGGGWCSPSCFGYNSGGRYNPASDSWIPTSMGPNVPVSRMWHTAVWTGSEMIVWGGEAIASVYTPLNSGGRYNPATDSWTPTAIGNNVPEQRYSHTAVWTGNDMIIWGGVATTAKTNTGGLYNPLNDNWMPTSTGVNTPSARQLHTAVWTGGEMIIWGADNLSTGGRYNSYADNWTPTSVGNNVPTMRSSHSAVWTGQSMIIWGGGPSTGGVYISGSAPSPANTLRGTKSSSVNLTWSWITGAGSYNVKRCDASVAPCTPATIVSTPTINQYSEPDDGLSHFYAIEAVNQCGATP